MRPLADIDPDEPPFEPGYLTGLVDPAMPPTKRRFAMAELVGRFHENTTGEPLDAAGKLAMADPVLAIFDDSALEEADLANAEKLGEFHDRAAAHYQNAAELYQILAKSWPAYVREQGEMEAMARRVALLNALTDLWTQEPPDHPVIIAGSTGTLKATARLMACVAKMPDGIIVLPALDKRVRDVSWDKITDDHPQNSLHRLIRTIEIERGDVDDWDRTERDGNLDARGRLIAEALVPVEDTADWPQRIESLRSPYAGGDFFEDAISGLSLIEARTEEEEALAIALAMREVLQTPGRTGALITPDAALARRVKSRLRRWGVDVDYSQGEPLEETPLGGFLAAILALAADIHAPVDLAELFKHRLTGLGRDPAEIARAWRALETQFFRGVRPRPELYSDHELIRAMLNSFEPLHNLNLQGLASVPEWARSLVSTAEILAATDQHSGRARLWVEDAGEKAAKLLEELIAFGDLIGPTDLAGFARLLGVLMRGRVVRPRYGTHPRLQILGPLEARMLSADLVILGGLNEGVWPSAPPKLPFLSRDMRRALGLSLPERRFGLAAHDFSVLAAGPRVLLTRSERSDGAPTVASRWIWRLKTLITGALGKEMARSRLNGSAPYLAWARALDESGAEEIEAARRPEPVPPLSARWPKGKRQLSITQIKTWIRDPYSIYAGKILALTKLDPLDAEIGGREYGNAIHAAVEQFTKTHMKFLPENAPARLAQLLADQLIDHGFENSELSREQVRLGRLATELAAHMSEQRAAGTVPVGVECWGKIKLPDVNFVLTGKADLIERGGDIYQVNDYKTGAVPTAAVVAAGFDPQLPLTAFMLREGAFDRLTSGETAELRYIKLGGTGDGVKLTRIDKPEGKNPRTVQDLVDDAVDTVTRLVADFDRPETAYPSQPRIQFTHDYSDFDHLARRGEWAKAGDSDGADG